MTTIAEDIKKVVDMGESLPPDKVVGGLKHVTVMAGKELVTEVRKHDKG